MRRVFRSSSHRKPATLEGFLFSSATSPPLKTPIHLQPYDKSKYEVPSSKLKVFLGFRSILLDHSFLNLRAVCDWVCTIRC